MCNAFTSNNIFREGKNRRKKGEGKRRAAATLLVQDSSSSSDGFLPSHIGVFNFRWLPAPCLSFLAQRRRFWRSALWIRGSLLNFVGKFSAYLVLIFVKRRFCRWRFTIRKSDILQSLAFPPKKWLHRKLTSKCLKSLNQWDFQLSVL